MNLERRNLFGPDYSLFIVKFLYDYTNNSRNSYAVTTHYYFLFFPSGIYIMRIHGTFVNFLDLSPAIQEDIIARLDPDSTRLVEVV